MTRALCCLGLKMGSENSTVKIYVKLSKRYDILALPLSEIKKMKCDTSFPLFHFKKSFKSYWVLIQRPNATWGKINIESDELMISTQKFWHTSNFWSILWPSSWDWQPRSEVTDLAYMWPQNRVIHSWKVATWGIRFGTIYALKGRFVMNDAI